MIIWLKIWQISFAELALIVTFKITFNDEKLCVKEVVLKKVVIEFDKDGDDDDDDGYDDEDEHVDTVERIGS